MAHMSWQRVTTIIRSLIAVILVLSPAFQKTVMVGVPRKLRREVKVAPLKYFGLMGVAQE